MFAVAIDTTDTFNFETPFLLFKGDYWQLPDAGPSYDVMPDGQKFLMMMQTAGLERAQDRANVTQLNVAENWFQELSSLAPPTE